MPMPNIGRHLRYGKYGSPATKPFLHEISMQYLNKYETLGFIFKSLNNLKVKYYNLFKIKELFILILVKSYNLHV